jgi:NTP pyrophosphatase (non-canonical NTP hydrolase)
MSQQPVDFYKFIQDAIVTESNVPTVEVNPEFFSDVLELAILSSMFVDQIKKHIFYRKQDEDNPEFFHPRPIDAVKTRDYLTRLSTVVQRLQTEGLSHEIANPTNKPLPVNTRLVHAFIGKYTESGELLEALFKAFQSGTPIDKANLREELGDDKWYDAIAFDELGADLNDVLFTVIRKLKERYPDKFNAVKALIRNLDAERAILEDGKFMEKSGG